MKLLIMFIYLFSIELRAQDCEKESVIKVYRPKYAKLFEITYYQNFKIITSKQDRFILASKKINCKTTLPIFSDEAKRFIATSTTHLPLLKEFHLEKTLVGFQGTRYIYDQVLNAQSIKDIQYLLNPEELLSLRPDLVMAYPANLNSPNRLPEFRKIGIPLVFNLDYEEKHPLARAEWIVFWASFFSKDDQAKNLFEALSKNYWKISESIKKFPKKKVLVGDIQGGKWSTCGGKSDLAQLIHDAGGELIFNDQHSETQFYSLEKVYLLKNRPDIWLTQNNWQDLSLIKEESRYKKFYNIPAYNNNARLNKYGFNDYWESGLMRPDLLLKDLTTIFHKRHGELTWYKKLQ